MPDSKLDLTRRQALSCMAFGGAGTLFVLSGGVLAPIDLARAASDTSQNLGAALFVQISDTHIGFNKEANPDVQGTLQKTIALANAAGPRFILHTGDITHLSKAEEFDNAQQLLKGLNAAELHTVPGEHDVTDGVGTEYFAR